MKHLKFLGNITDIWLGYSANMSLRVLSVLCPNAPRQVLGFSSNKSEIVTLNNISPNKELTQWFVLLCKGAFELLKKLHTVFYLLCSLCRSWLAPLLRRQIPWNRSPQSVTWPLQTLIPLTPEWLALMRLCPIWIICRFLRAPRWRYLGNRDYSFLKEKSTSNFLRNLRGL